jgi:hypothetical protein
VQSTINKSLMSEDIGHCRYGFTSSTYIQVGSMSISQTIQILQKFTTHSIYAVSIYDLFEIMLSLNGCA